MQAKATPILHAKKAMETEVGPVMARAIMVKILARPRERRNMSVVRPPMGSRRAARVHLGDGIDVDQAVKEMTRFVSEPAAPCSEYTSGIHRGWA